MHEYSDVEWGRLTAYLANEQTDEERAAFERWLAEDAGRQSWLARRRAEWEAMRGDAPPTHALDLEATKAAVRARIGVAATPVAGDMASDASSGAAFDAPLGAPRRQPVATPHATSHAARVGDLPMRRMPSRWPLGRAGAAWTAALLVVVAVVGTYARAAWRHPASPRVWDGTTGRTYATGVGQRATVLLADGSRVTLAPRTVLTVDDSFNHDARNVMLHGQARFDVVPNTAVPFTVQTGRVTTRVLGTVFDVRHYVTDSSSRVFVLSGKVLVRSGGRIASAATLTAGMESVVSDSTMVTVAQSPVTDTDWVQGHLVFHNAPVPDVLTALQRWYGYQFRLTDSTLAKTHITTVFEMDSRGMLQQLKNLLKVDMTFQDSVVTLAPHHGVARRTTTVREQLVPSSNDSREVGR